MPRSSARSFSRIVSGVAARSTFHSSRLKAMWREDTRGERRGGVARRPNSHLGRDGGHDAQVEPIDRDERKRRGAWYTPPVLARFLVEQAVMPAAVDALRRAGGGAGDTPVVRVLDPACGDGRLLAAARELVTEPLARRFAGDSPAEAFVRTGAGEPARPLAVELVGVELDPASAAGARRALPGGQILVGDGRVVDHGRPFDAVIGNPPYLGQLARATSRGGRSALGGGPYADVAAEFLVRAVALARPDGGRVALVLPQSILASRDTASIRAAVAGQAAVTGLWWAAERVFDAGVHVCVVVLQRGVEQGPVRRWVGASFAPLADATPSGLDGSTWSPLVADAAGVPPVDLSANAGRVADLASATAGFRQQYYGLVPFVSDDGPGAPLVTAGLIGPGSCAWGRQPVRFAKRRFAAPRLDLDALEAGDPTLGAWVRRRLRPKVVVAPQTRVIEAAVDEEGTWVPSVPVVAVHPHRPEDLWALGAALLAPPVAAWAAARYLGAGLGPTALKLSASQIARPAHPRPSLARRRPPPAPRRHRWLRGRDVRRVRRGRRAGRRAAALVARGAGLAPEPASPSELRGSSRTSVAEPEIVVLQNGRGTCGRGRRCRSAAVVRPGWLPRRPGSDETAWPWPSPKTSFLPQARSSRP